MDIVTLIPTFVSAALGAVSGVVAIYVGIAQRLSTLEAKFDALKASVDKHNGFAERLPVVEQGVKDLKRDTDEIYGRLRAVEMGGGRK